MTDFGPGHYECGEAYEMKRPVDYKAIADRLVERGIGCSLQGYYAVHPTISGPLEEGRPPYWFQLNSMIPRDFCHDWRVAGACMERVAAKGNWELLVCAIQGEENEVAITELLPTDNPLMRETIMGNESNESLPLAIILAYLETTE